MTAQETGMCQRSKMIL